MFSSLYWKSLEFTFVAHLHFPPTFLAFVCAWVTGSRANKIDTTGTVGGANGPSGTLSASEPSFEFNYDAADTSPDWPWVSNLAGLELSEASCVARSQQWVDEQMRQLRAWESATMRGGYNNPEAGKGVGAGGQDGGKTDSGAGDRGWETERERDRGTMGSAVRDGNVGDWNGFSAEHAFGAGMQTLRTLLFFLHVPRTGGRTYHAWYYYGHRWHAC